MKIKHALLHNTGWKVFTMLFSFVNNIIIARMLGAAESASLFYTLATYALLSTILRFGLENGIVYFASKNPAGTRRLSRFIFLIALFQVAISYIVLRYYINVATGYSLLWSVIFVAGGVFQYYLTAFYQAGKMFVSINASGLAVTALQTIALCILWFQPGTGGMDGQGNVKDEILVILSAGLLLHLVFLVVYFNRHRPMSHTAAGTAPTMKELFSYSAINFAATVMLFLVMRADFYFVARYCSDLELGNYVQAVRIGQMALVFPGLIGGVIFPYTVNAADDFSHKIAFFCRVTVVAFLVLFIGLLLFGKWLFVTLLGADFNLVFYGILGTIGGLFCLSINLILVSYFEGRNMQRIVLIANAATLVFLLLADFLLVPHYGYIAAAVVFTAANFLGMIVLLNYFIRKTDLQLRQLFLFTRSDLFIFRLRR